MKYSAIFLLNACLHPKLRLGNTTANTGIAAQCTAHKYGEALATTAAPSATLEIPRDSMSPVGTNCTGCTVWQLSEHSTGTGSMHHGGAMAIPEAADAARTIALGLRGTLNKRRAENACHIARGCLHFPEPDRIDGA